MDENQSDVLPVQDDNDESAPKLKTVILEFDDGTIKFLEGAQAAQWLDSLNNIVFVSWVHGKSMPESEWKLISREHASSLFQ